LAVRPRSPATAAGPAAANAETEARPAGDAIADLARQLLDLDDGQLSPRDKRVIERVVKRLAISRDVGEEFTRDWTLGQRLADAVAKVGGSWGFITGFAVVLASWVTLNTAVLATRAFDPYPYILLNLCLSVLAAIQGPIILMSQNRAAARDRIMARHDYEVNLKAEIEIAGLHAKLDQIRAHELATLIEHLEAAVESIRRPAAPG
jgi:uncharacterized membrane protein